MVKLGRVYRGLMVDMRARNAKLKRRAAVIVSQIIGCAAPDAARFVEQADGDVKVAILLGFGLTRWMPLRSSAATTAIYGWQSTKLPRKLNMKAKHDPERTASTAMAREIAEIPPQPGDCSRDIIPFPRSPTVSGRRLRASSSYAAVAVPVTSASICGI